MGRIDCHDTFLQLVRLGIGLDETVSLPKSIDWPAIQALATQQGLSAIILDSIERLPEGLRPPRVMTLQWIGEVLHNYEHRYEYYRKVIGEMAGFYNAHGLKMMVLKGYACSLNWPKPEHRPCGDIDIWQFGEYKKADALVAAEKGIKIDNSHHHHTVFTWRGIAVENHYDFVNVHHHKSNVKLELLFKKLGQDDTHWVEVSGEKVYLPSPNLHALFLMRHMMAHFAAIGITLRQLLDWAFHVKAHSKEIDWPWLEGVLEEYGMLPAFNIFNEICVEDLGFDASIFPTAYFDLAVKERVLNDILHSEFQEEQPKGLLRRLLFKFRRWKNNAWKHKLCYNDTMWSAFWSGVWGHILKPKGI